MRQNEEVKDKTMKGKKKYQRKMGHSITSPKDKKAQLPTGLVVWPLFIFFFFISTSHHPHPPLLIIQLYQGGSAFFCPA